ncbi:MAG: protein-L-isoaspartate(D-aspartate) O-methyltransferase [candidate division KSB1 bacterium]|nr:protein-L-isoaspartate(D-aspartate) O-methyltransferase [candidate division KSB1 bacterium]MDZ7401416.1 protein-L-isoaspartate(D-aspartate) O-methyltransferase [candidate division KSB1 bacterium]
MNQLNDARRRMVHDQLVRRGIRHPAVLRAMRKIKRHLFVDEKDWERAYDDTPLSIPCSQTISQPYMVALMTELIEPEKNKKVLEIGTGSGYQTAILAETCGQVYSIERHRELADRAQQILRALGYSNVEIRCGDGTMGWPEHAPFDAIIVTAGAPEIPETLVQQLVEGGLMVIPVGSQYRQNLELIKKRGDSYITKTICGCIFVPLIGKEGWKE